MLQILHQLGAHVERASGTVTVKAEEIKTTTPYEIVRKMRASICVLGPLVGRVQRAEISLPGGCVIGDRPIDLHLRGLEALGAYVKTERGNVHVLANELRGDEIDMAGKNGSTVLGTDNVMMAAVLAKGTTVIENAACEPEVVDLANFLNKMGAKISGAGTPEITIEGVEKLHGAEHTVIPDRIEAGTFLVAGAMTEGQVTLQNVEPKHIRSLIQKLKEAGFDLEVGEDTIKVGSNGSIRATNIATSPYPGFPTDMQAQMCALLSRADGTSIITEKVFPERFMHISELKRMGADADRDGSTAVIRGVGSIEAAPVMASDLRASAALLLAGLVAKGETEVLRVYHIDRGYEHIDQKLALLGAKIRRRKE
jgi:UDP-N-acetylglucosamine 1-carboxyvinyltransferase